MNHRESNSILRAFRLSSTGYELKSVPFCLKA